MTLYVHIFGSVHAMPMKTYCIIPLFDSMKQYQLILTIILVIINIVAIYGLRKSSEIVYYQITQLSDQKYKLVIPFAEHNFGPFGVWTCLHCNILVRIIINNTVWSVYIIELVSSNLYLLVLSRYIKISISGPVS